MSNPFEALEDGPIRQLLNVGAAFAALQIVADIVEKVEFDEDDAEGITWLPVALQVHTKARILEAVELLREEVRHIDGLLLELTTA